MPVFTGALYLYKNTVYAAYIQATSGFQGFRPSRVIRTAAQVIQQNSRPKLQLDCKMQYRNAIAIVMSTLFLSSCVMFVTNDDFGKSWQGQTTEKLQRQWGSPAEVTRNSDGTSEVRYEIFHGGCTYYFTADATGKIVGYRYKVNGLGGSCKPIG